MQSQTLNKWQLIHTYNAERGHLRCPDDDMPYRVMILDGNVVEPVFYCSYCQSKVRFGSDVWNQILEAVQEVYPDVTLEKSING